MCEEERRRRRRRGWLKEKRRKEAGKKVWPTLSAEPGFISKTYKAAQA